MAMAFMSFSSSIFFFISVAFGVFPHFFGISIGFPFLLFIFSFILSLKSPYVGISILSFGFTVLLMAHSTAPVPDAVSMKTSFSVWKRYFAFWMISLCIFWNSGPLWPMIGLIMALETLSGMFVDPGSIIRFLSGILVFLFF